VFVFFRVWFWRSREQAKQIVVVVVARLLAGVVARLLVVLFLRGFGRCWCCIANAVWLEFLGEDGSGFFSVATRRRRRRSPSRCGCRFFAVLQLCTTAIAAATSILAKPWAAKSCSFFRRYARFDPASKSGLWC
jgi:hypothetical protein